MPTNRAGVRNEGYWGMALRPNTTYKGSLYAKADSADMGPMTAELINDNTGKVGGDGDDSGALYRVEAI